VVKPSAGTREWTSCCHADPGGCYMAYPVSEAHLREAEARLGRSLPPALRARLLRDNGGAVECDGEEWQLFPVWDPTDRRTMRKTASHLVAETQRAASRWARFPVGAMAIAENGSGDLLVLRSGSDQVEMWLHETGQVVRAAEPRKRGSHVRGARARRPTSRAAQALPDRETRTQATRSPSYPRPAPPPRSSRRRSCASPSSPRTRASPPRRPWPWPRSGRAA
jgi:hypothetical protein